MHALTDLACELKAVAAAGAICREGAAQESYGVQLVAGPCSPSSIRREQVASSCKAEHALHSCGAEARAVYARRCPLPLAGQVCPRRARFRADLKEPGLANVGPTIVNLLGFESPSNLVASLLA